MNAILISAVSGVVMMFSGILLKDNRSIRVLAHVLLLLLLAGNILELRGISLLDVQLNGMLEFDRFALLATFLSTACTLAFFLLSSRDMEKVGLNYSDYFALIFFILCGIALSVSFRSLLILFLGIEIISIPLYILSGADKRNLKSNEASLKYFLMGSFSTGLMLMGIALVYGATGTFLTGKMQLADAGAQMPVLMMTGLMLLLFALSFKVSAAPFHFWTPDVYDGAP
ncbi:MAG TPA: proton-conducting transporter membrane subunit, partial [Chitinophagaceae bacterium]|nr:proton-conducting transporter membrane subunit [Chitinophagaceae bacterium]